MNESVVLNSSENLVPKNYLKAAEHARKTREKLFRLLIEKKKIPEIGWDDSMIEEFVSYLASLDSNNFPKKCGLGEREARIACDLVAKRHYYFGHGIGRSGDLLEAQPKAAGSTLLAGLTNALILDLLKIVGIHNTKFCFLVPMATGMTLNLCFLTLKKQRPQAKYVLWSRIDQKACFKSITTAGLSPVIIEPQRTANGLVTNIQKFEAKINIIGSENIVCIYSTTSCFAPRLCDELTQLAVLAKTFEVPHLVNNAYGLQSSFLTHQIEQASRQGRVDLFVQSTDKNLLVPVGGAIVAGFSEAVVKDVAKTYVGRASSSQTLDVLMTLLSLGSNGYKDLLEKRKTMFQYLRERLRDLAQIHGEEVLETKNNPVSVAFTLQRIGSKATLLGSMLYTRGVSGARVITSEEIKTIDSVNFQGWGSHCSEHCMPYITFAASLGGTKKEVDTLIPKLDECLKQILSQTE